MNLRPVPCPVPLLLLLLLLVAIRGAHSAVRIVANYDEKDKPVSHFELKKHFKLSCNLTVEGEKNVIVKWKHNGTDIIPSNSIKTTNERGVYKLSVERDAIETDAGEYACAAYSANSPDPLDQANITVTSKFFVKLPTGQNAVEGETLSLQCTIAGSPPPELSWMYDNSTHNYTITSDTPRYNLSDVHGVKNALLTIVDVQAFDRGNYTCLATSAYTDQIASDSCYVRIKDKYAALWPFLGICAEVFVLCAVIFIYEKKRNKTELEESDTDQSPDQKNTPDHGKDSNLRHRQ